MKITGIIAEYNPFHNGHAYQIEKIRKETGSDYVIVAMSGDFVQRGTPAIIDKYTRTKMALSCGADLVLELPTLWAVSSAEYFAMAGVTMFDKMGCVDDLCFGAECDDLSLLQQIADVLVDEPPEYQSSLASYLKSGQSFPSARMNALTDYFKTYGFCPDTDSAELEQVLSSPNNILAIEYLKALSIRHSSIRPFLIKREGAGYHDKNLDVPNASATAIRGALFSATPDVLTDAMPPKAHQIFSDALLDAPILCENDFSSILQYLLLEKTREELNLFADTTEDICNRMKNQYFSFESYVQYCTLCKSKDVTYTRMSRIFAHLLLNHTKTDYKTFLDMDYIPYLRPLGFCKSKAQVLSIIKKNSSIPLISKLSDARELLSEEAYQLLEKDLFATGLYAQIQAQKNRTTPRSEFTREIVLLD